MKDHTMEKGSAPSVAYDVQAAKRDAKKGDLRHLIELAELAEWERKGRHSWFGIAKAMGYENGGEWPAVPELGEFVCGQVEKSRAKVRANILSALPSGEGWRPIPFTDDVVRYVGRFSGQCRDCADEHGVCPSSGLPCDERHEKAIRYVITALNYGFGKGFLPPPPSSGEA
jgi:hypothetical protein